MNEESPTRAPQDDDWITSREVASIIDVEPETLSKWRQQGRGPRFSIAISSRSPRYRRADVQAFMEQDIVVNTVEARRRKDTVH